jgi:hypothetical protein
MTTVAEFIAYLETLPPETVVTVAENVDNGYSGNYVTFKDLQLPTEFSRTCSDNLDFFNWVDKVTPEIQLGSR